MEYPDQNSLSDVLGVLRRGFLLAIAVGGLFAAGVYFLAEQVPNRYESTASVLVVNSGEAPGSFEASYVLAPRIDAAAYRAATLSGPVLDDALERSGVAVPTAADREALARSLDIGITEMEDSSVVTFTVIAGTVDRAPVLANGIAQAIVAWDQRRASRAVEAVERALADQIAGADQTIATLQQAGAAQAEIAAVQARRNDAVAQLATAQSLRNSAVGRLELLDPAPLPIEPISNRAVLFAAAALLLGAFVAYAALIVRNATDPRTRTMAAFAAETGVPVIATFVTPRTKINRIDRETASYLRAHVINASSDAKPVIVAVTSPYDDPISSKVATGLAENCARSGLSTLLIDANLRSPRIGAAFGFRNQSVRDLESYLASASAPFEPAMISTGQNTSLHVVPSYGSVRHPGELLERAFASRLESWHAPYDVIVVDTPPVLEAADALIVAPHATGVLLVADLERLLRSEARRAVLPFRLIGTPILGATVTNASDEPISRRQRKAMQSDTED